MTRTQYFVEQIRKIEANTIIYGFLLFLDTFIIQSHSVVLADEESQLVPFGLHYWLFCSPLFLVMSSYFS